MMGLEGFAQVNMVELAEHKQTQGAGGEEVGKLGGDACSPAMEQ